MSTSKEFIQYIVDQVGRAVGDENISIRKMFGEYALYYLGTTVGLVCDNTLFIKITDATKEFLDGHETGFPYPGAKPWYMINEDDLDSGELMREVIEVVYEERVEKKSKKSKKPL